MEIKFFNSGLNGFEVTDNGKGITSENFTLVCKRGTTSKIYEYDDIFRIKSLGFRGEALSSLCNIGIVTISTRTSNEETGWALEFDRMGSLTS